MAKPLDRKHKIEHVPLGRIKVSQLAQRELRPNRVNALLSGFDIDRIGIPVLSYRAGTYWNVDGQHRIAALKQWLGPNWEEQKIECQVFQGLDEAQEAAMFLQLNNMLPVNVFDKFMTAITAGLDTECAIRDVVEKQGLHISHGGAGSVSCVAALSDVFDRSDSQTLGRTLRIIRDAYGDSGFRSSVIRGIGQLCHRYNGELDEQVAKQKLGDARGGVNGLLNRATEIALRTGNSKSFCIAAAAVDIINSGRGGGKLPSWWKTEEAA